MDCIYTKEYFLTQCEGFRSFKSSGGFFLSKRLKKVYDIVSSYNFSRILDFGCGRGEFSLKFSLNGVEAYACDVSDDAIEIANSLKNKWEKKRGKLPFYIFKIINSKLPFENSFFDACVMNDVVEHIEKKELMNVFEEIFRVLKPQGKIFIHTSPGKLFIKYGLFLYRIVGFFTGFRFDSNLKDILPDGLKKPYHINELSVWEIKKFLKSIGFEKVKYSLWKNPHYIYYFTGSDRFLKIIRKISFLIPFKEIVYSDIFVYAEKGGNDGT
ncbi:MAG: methyltransferase domain-containing protein [Elusimicrobiales bacterium]|nr:methyltransferase domain-containing protein [Elusimicrobiales bacterium]